jgi:hypothetical protein
MRELMPLLIAVVAAEWPARSCREKRAQPEIGPPPGQWTTRGNALSSACWALISGVELALHLVHQVEVEVERR